MTFDYSDKGKQPLVIDMEGMTLDNENYRTTLWTGDKIQLTVMTNQEMILVWKPIMVLSSFCASNKEKVSAKWDQLRTILILK